MKSLPIDIWLRVGRVALIAYTVLVFALSITGTALFPAYASQHAADFRFNDYWTAGQVQTTLDQLGWPAIVPAYVNLARSLLLLVSGCGLALLLLWRRPTSAFILYLAFAFTSFGISEVFFKPLSGSLPWTLVLTDFFGRTSWQFYFLTFYFFPNGRPVPGWTRWVVLFWGLLMILHLVFSGSPSLDGSGIYFLLVFIAIFSQIYRYFRRSDTLQRLQTRWITALVMVMLAYGGLVAPLAFQTHAGADLRGAFLFALINNVILAVLFSLFPVTVTIAILRYRLYDIDLIIRRTLIYGVLTFLLGLVYFGLVTVLQSLFVGFSGQASPLTIVLTTLAIAGLFNPLRRRIQALIDRRFFRGRYNAEHALTRFGLNLRERVDLKGIESELVGVVSETVQPVNVSLWMREMEKK